VKQLRYDPTKMAQLKKLIVSESQGENLKEITLEKLVIGNDIIEQLPIIMGEISDGKVNKVLIVADETPIKRGEDVLKDFVYGIFQQKGLQAELLTLTADSTGLLHADMEAVHQVRSKITVNTGIVGIGGGTITDICKYATYLFRQDRTNSVKVPLIVCQAATSGSAFGANQAVIFKDGVKRTLPAVYPTVVMVDLDVIASAPRNLNIAGFGDMSGILISSVDWYVSNLVGMSDGYSELVVDIMQDSGQALLDIDRNVGNLSPEGIETLAKILVMMGIVSSIGYGTAPISGFDHMISHALDFEGVATGRKLSLHGAQVGLGTAYAAVAYNFFLREFTPDTVDLNRCYPSDKEAFDGMIRGFDHLDLDEKSVNEIWTHYREKLNLWEEKRPLFEKFLADWSTAGGPREQIAAKLKSAEEIAESIHLSGNPTLPEELIPPLSRQQMRFAFLNARFMRNRFILADIMGAAGIMTDRFWRRVDAEVRRILDMKGS
jgi:glycerol-1-phosphate dehydrogenase [NAD(P)+]